MDHRPCLRGAAACAAHWPGEQWSAASASSRQGSARRPGDRAAPCPHTPLEVCATTLPLLSPAVLSQGAGFPSCQAYYPPSPVSALLAASSPPTQLGNATSPSPAPAAASPPAVAVEPPAEPPVAAAQPPSPAASPPQSPPPSPLPVPAPAPAPQPSPAPAPPSPAPPSPSPPSPSPAPPPPDPSPPPSPSPLPPPPSPAEQAPPELVPLETSGSGGSGGSGGGTSTGAKVGALVGGIVGGMILGAAGALRCAALHVLMGRAACADTALSLACHLACRCRLSAPPNSLPARHHPPCCSHWRQLPRLHPLRRGQQQSLCRQHLWASAGGGQRQRRLPPVAAAVQQPAAGRT